MKTFKELYEACCAACEKRAEIEEVKEPTGDLKDACWKGYTAVGMKMKNGRKVPNCVPVKEEVEQIDEGVIDSIKRATGFAMPSKHGDTVRGNVVSDYLEDNTAHSPKTLDKVRKTKYKLHHIDLETAKRHRDYTNKKVGTGGRDIIDPDKMDRIRRKNVTHDSLVKHPPVIHHDGTILDGNHRIQRAIELKHSKIPVLAPHDWKPRGVNEEVEQIDEIRGIGGEESYDEKMHKQDASKMRNIASKLQAKLDAIQKPKSQAAHTKALKGMSKTPVAQFLKTRKGDGTVRTEEVEQIDEISTGKKMAVAYRAGKRYIAARNMDASLRRSGAHSLANADVTDKKKIINTIRRSGTLGKLASIAGAVKKTYGEEAELDESYMMAAAASANQPQYKERTPEEEKKHAERKAEKYLHMPGKNAAKKRKYWVKKVNKLHGIPEEVELDEVSKKTLNRYVSKARDSEQTHRAYSYRYHGYGGEGHTPDYEEDIISGKRPARKRAPAQTSDYAKRREQEKKQDVSEGSTLSDVSLVYISTDRAKAFEDWMESEGLTTDVPKRNKGKYIVYDYSKQDHTSKMYADEWNEKKHAERKAEKYLHMPGKNAAKKRKYWVKKVNKLHGIPEETQKGKNVVPPHVGALATGGIVKEEEGDNKPLGKVMRAGDGKKKFKVYVKNAKGNVVKVGFGDPNMEIKRDDPERRKNFRARHNCDTATDRTTPRYWSCRQWRAGAKVEA